MNPTRQIKAWGSASGIEEFFLVIVLLPEHGGPSRIDTGKDATIGDTGICPLDSFAKTGECGGMLNSSPSIRGKGLVVEVLDMTFAFAFDHLGLEKVSFFTGKDNVPMKNLLVINFGIPAAWKDEQDDWEIVATREWWANRSKTAGKDEIVVDVYEEVLA